VLWPVYEKNARSTQGQAISRKSKPISKTLKADKSIPKPASLQTDEPLQRLDGDGGRDYSKAGFNDKAKPYWQTVIEKSPGSDTPPMAKKETSELK